MTRPDARHARLATGSKEGCPAIVRRGSLTAFLLLLGLVAWPVLPAAAQAGSSSATAPPTSPDRPATTAPAGTSATKPDEPLSGLEYRELGPWIGGRVARVTGIPGDPSTWFAATAAGGVWRSTDGGRTWKGVFDDQPVSSTGAIAVSPADPNLVWVGAGEGNIRGNVAKGDGIYRSFDRGETWQKVLALDGQVGALAVHPRDPGIAWAAVLGSPFGTGKERGVYRTKDGGSSWQKVLYVDEKTGACDVALDPANPRILFAGTWQTRRYPWTLESGGPGSGLWRSTDGGDSWTRLTADGLPAGPWGKVGVRVAPSDARRVYALVEAKDGGLFRSDDGGDSWKRVNASRGLRQRAWYYTTLTVDPRSPDVVWFPEVAMLKTIDGGATVRTAKGGGWDYHDVWIDPSEPRRMIVGSDAGVSLSSDGGESWYRPPMGIAQLYHVAVAQQAGDAADGPYRVLGAVQDWGTVSGPSDSLHRGGILLGDWHGVGGGEAGHVAASSPDEIWAGEYLGIITRWDGRTGTSSHVGIYPDLGSGHGAGDLKYRFQWTAPIVVSPHDPKTVYHAANVLFRTRDGGQHWEAISPDLTRDDPEKQKWSGGPITGDNTGVEFYDTIFAVAESPVTAGVIWAGSDDGLVHVTRDGGAQWSKVTPPDMPEWATVTTIEPSRRDTGTAWVVADNHRLGDDRPYLWVTEDYGKSWRSLTRGLDARTYLHVVRADWGADPAAVKGAPTLLFLGTERGVQLSRDGGASWQPLRLNLPTVAVHDLVVHQDDLVVGTTGRGIWVLDDLTPVREWSDSVAKAPLHLFPPRETVAWRRAGEPFGDDHGSTSNPPGGAAIAYRLREQPKGPLKLEVLDAGGTLVRTLTSEVETPPIGPEHPDWDPDGELEADLAAEPGLHRVTWDLDWQGAPYIPRGMVDTGDPHSGPPALPGDYTVRLTVDGTTVSQPLRVLPDPRLTVPRADQEAQLAFLLRLRERMTEIAQQVARLRSVREQLQARAVALAGDSRGAELLSLGEQLASKLDAIEGRLHNRQSEVTYDILAGREGGAMLHSRYAALYDYSRSHPGPPTQGMLEVETALDGELAAQRQALDDLFARELPRLQSLAAERGIGYLVGGG